MPYRRDVGVLQSGWVRVCSRVDAVVPSVRASQTVGTEALHHERGLVPEHVRLDSLEALPPPQEAAVVKHVLRGRVQGPVVAFARVAWLPWDFDKAVVEGQVVSDGVLPRRELLTVIREAVADELADAAQCKLLLRALEDGHSDEGYVGVRGLHQAVFGFLNRA